MIMKKKRNNTASKGQTIVGIISTILFAVLSVMLLIQLFKINMAPTKYVVGICILLVIVLIGLVSTVASKKKVTGIFTIVLALILCAGMSFATYYLRVSNEMLSEISEQEISTDHLSLMVKTDDPAATLQDAASYNVGILTTIGRTATDEALQAAAQENVILQTTEYASIVDLAQAFTDGEVNGILTNPSYLAMLDETDEYAELSETLKEVWTYDYERELVFGTPAPSEQTEAEPAETEPAQEEDDGTPSIANTPFVVYISGNDAAGTLSANGRSDVNILMAVNPVTREILLVNTPRDYYVTLAGIGEKDKLTHAGMYGVDTSMNTLGDLYGVKVPYYVRLNFTGFMNIIDALGGVTVESDVDFTVGNNHYVVGPNNLDGKAALTFARERHSFASGDRQRGKNQQAVIKAVIRKACSPAILTNYADVLTAVSESVQTNFSTDDISKLVKKQLADNKEWTVNSISVDGSDSSGPVYSMPGFNAYRMIPDEDTVAAAQEALKQVLGN